MSKIQKVLNNIRVGELNGLTQQITNEYKKYDYSVDAYLTKLFDQLMISNDNMSKAIKRDVVVSELEELDTITDNSFTNLYGLSKGYTYHPDNSIAEPAKQLFKLIDKYGLHVKNESYREEYPLLASLLNESNIPEYQDFIAKLSGCAVCFRNLKIAVDNFNTKQNTYHTEKNDQKNLQSATRIKKEIIALLNEDLTIYLGAMQKAKPAAYDDLATFITNRISDSNTAVRNHRSKN